MAQRVVIVGTGLIGGSVGMALRASGTAYVRGFDRSPEHARLALELGSVDEALDDLREACEGADAVVVATPVGEIVQTVAELAQVAPPGTVVTDVGSTKEPIVAEAERRLGRDRPFVGGHPMAGSEREGVQAARADLFEGALWILTPTPGTDAGAFRAVHNLVTRLGARTLALDPATHDRLVALVSHLPYALATTLMEVAGAQADDRVFRAAAGSFRDVTRTAGSNPRVWRDILAANRAALLEELDAFAGRLSVFRDALAAEDWTTIEAFIERARATRKRLPLKGERTPVEAFTVEIPVPDRAGVLADVTTAVGALGVNIEDIALEHGASGGVVRLVVDGGTTAARVADLLRSRGYRAVTGRVEA